MSVKHGGSALLCCILMVLSFGVAAGAAVSEDIATALDCRHAVVDRVRAIQTLARSDDERALETLATILSDGSEDGRIRATAARGLAFKREPRAEIITLLEDIYQEPSADDNLLYTVLFSLGRMQATEAFALLAGAVSNGRSMIRFKAAQALGMLGSDDAISLLITRLDGETDKMVRAEIVQALGETRNSKAEAALVRALRNDSEPLVRMNAALMLGGYESLSAAAVSALDRAEYDESPAIRRIVKGIER
jgi:HEAT repeat protein